jgi:hypothetical protein
MLSFIVMNDRSRTSPRFNLSMRNEGSLGAISTSHVIGVFCMKKLAILLAVGAAALFGGSAAGASDSTTKANAGTVMDQSTDFSSHRRHWRHRHVHRHWHHRHVHRHHRPYYRSYGYAPSPYYYGGGPAISFSFGGGGGGWGHHHRRHHHHW